MARGAPSMPRPPKPVDPSKAVTKPPRLKPISTREYGKGGTPLSGAPDLGVRGAGIGYGGPRLGYDEGGAVQDSLSVTPAKSGTWSDEDEARLQATNNTIENTVLSRGLNLSVPKAEQAIADTIRRR